MSKFSLDMRGSPAPHGAKGGIPYASSGSDIGWTGHASGTQILQQTDDGTPTWVTQTLGSLVTLKETVFAGMTPQSITNGQTPTLDGSVYTASVVGNGAIDIVATGLRFRQGTTSGTNFQIMSINAGSTGDFKSIVGEDRFRRGRFGFWIHIASYDYTNASGQVRGTGEVNTTGTTRWSLALARNRSLNGTPATAVGGLATFYNWNGAQDPSSYPGVSSADTLLGYFRQPDMVDVYYGTYSAGWPTMDSMTMMGTIRMSPSGFVLAAAAGPTATGTGIRFYIGGSAASAGTYEIIFDRWRITTWE